MNPNLVSTNQPHMTHLSSSHEEEQEATFEYSHQSSPPNHAAAAASPPSSSPAAVHPVNQNTLANMTSNMTGHHGASHAQDYNPRFSNFNPVATSTLPTRTMPQNLYNQPNQNIPSQYQTRNAVYNPQYGGAYGTSNPAYPPPASFPSSHHYDHHHQHQQQHSAHMNKYNDHNIAQPFIPVSVPSTPANPQEINMKQRRGHSELPNESVAPLLATNSHTGSDTDADEEDKSNAMNPSLRRILRVSKRKSYSNWSTEIQAMLIAIYGTRGSHNPRFWIKIAATAFFLLFLLGWLVFTPSRSHLVTPLKSTALLARTPGGGRGDPTTYSGEDVHHEIDLETLNLPVYSTKDVTIFTVHTPELDVKIPAGSASSGAEQQHNVHLRAINSWIMRVDSPSQIHVYVKEYAHCLSMQVLGVQCRVSACWEEQFDSPKLTCIFKEANSRADTPLMFYVDDHIILFEDAMSALLRVGRLEHFLMVGRSQPLGIKLDPNLDLSTWQRDLESSLFLDSSGENLSALDSLNAKQHLLLDLSKTTAAQQAEIAAAASSKSLHYMGFSRTEIDFSAFPDGYLMTGGGFAEHGWESAFLAAVLVQDSAHVIDVSMALTAVEFTHTDPSNRTSIMNQHNNNLAQTYTGLNSLHTSVRAAPIVSHLSLGRLENAHYVLTGRCPTCILKENREADLPLILLRKANAAKQIIVIIANADYLALAFNWICRAEQLNIHNFVFLAEDRVSYRILRKMNIAAVLRKDAPYRKPASPAGSKSFQESLYLRALFFNQIVSLGFSLVMTHLDTIWFENPLTIFAESDCDMFVQMEKAQRTSGGILTIRNSVVGQAFAQDYLSCEQENWNFIQLHGKPRFSYSDDVDIDCVDLISTRLMRRNNLKRCVLDPMKYVSEKEFFDRQTPQRSAIWPYFVHLNAAEGMGNKTGAFTSWHLWGVDDDKMLTIPRISQAETHGKVHCKQNPPALPKPHEEAQNQMKILIHLLASTEFKGLELTLLSLTSARYDANVVIDLTITLQQPEIESTANSKAYLKTKALIQQLQWNHGSLTFIILDAFVGPTDLWVDNWGLSADNQAFVLVLQAGQVLSPYWFAWIKQALEQYYFDPFAYDPQLMAISLVHQMTIVGESPSSRYGSKLPSTVLSKIRKDGLLAKKNARLAAEALAKNQSTTLPPEVPDPNPNVNTYNLYLYQFVPFTGTLFFPRHFSTFLQWYLVQNVTDATVPCVPTLLSNKWWAVDPVRNWYVWLNRFAFEAGWYSLYTNFHSQILDPSIIRQNGPIQEGPRALVVDDLPTAGSLVISLLKRLSINELYFPPRSDPLLFDFHFQQFNSNPAQLTRRKFMFPPLPSSTSMTRAAEMEAFAYAKGDLGEDVSFSSSRSGEGGSALVTGKLHAEKRVDDHSNEAHLQHEDASCEVPEEDISHLDVMVESMIEEMEDTAGKELSSASYLSAGPSPTAVSKVGKPGMDQLRAAAAARSNKHRGGFHTHKAHHTRPIRGVHLDRCYVVEHATATVEKEECAHCFELHPKLKASLLAKVAAEKRAARQVGTPDATPSTAIVPSKSAGSSALSQPASDDPLASYLISTMDAEELYNLMYDMARPHLPAPMGTSTSKKFDVNSGVRFMVYQPQKPAPFDRHLRGIYFSFLIALLTNRILLIDLPDLDMLYSSPFANGAEWSYKKFAALFKAMNLESDIFDGKKAAELRTANLDHLYYKPLLIHNDMVTHDRVLFKNVLYKKSANALFKSASRMRRTGYVIKTLLSKPKPALTDAAGQIMRQVGLFGAKYSLSVHVVVPANTINKPATATDPLPGVPGRHWDCIRSFLLSMQMVSEDAVIFFSTNKPSSHAFALARKEMGRFGRVVTHPFAHNVNISTGSVSSSTTSSSIALDSNGREIIDPALVSGYIFGETDVSISSGTTYGIFYAARTNFAHKAMIVKLATPKKPTEVQEEDYCGPMHRLDLSLPEDIIY